VKRTLVVCTENLLATSVLAVLVIVPVVLFFKFLSKVVPILIMWGASVNCAEVVLKRIEQLYEQKIAFWVLMQASTLTLLKVPVVGTVFDWLRIPTLVAFYMFGHPILTVIGNSFGLVKAIQNTPRSSMDDTHKRYHGIKPGANSHSPGNDIIAKVAGRLPATPNPKQQYGAHRRDSLGSPDSTDTNVASRV